MDSAEFFLGTVTGVSSANGFQIQLDGQEQAMSKHYKMMITGANVPVVGDRVVVMKHSGTYIVMGKIGMPNQNIGKVNRSGDTMTGNITLTDAHIHMDDPNFTVGTRPSTNQWSKPFRIRDADGKTLGRIQGFYGTDGTCGLQLYADQLVNGEGKYNFLSINIGESGVASINMNHPEAWRSALNALNKSGDTMTGLLNINMESPGVIEKTTGRASSDTVTANTNSYGFRVVDKNGDVVALYTDRYETTGENGAFIGGYRMVNGTNIGNNLRLLVDAAGNKLVYVTSPGAWRKALGLGNASGAFPITVAQGGTGNTGTATETTLANIATAGTGVTLLDASFCSWGKLAMLFVHGKTTAALTGPAVLFTVVSGKRPVSNAPVQIGRSPDHNALIGSNGQAQLGGSLSSGQEFSCAAVYLLA